MIERLKSLESDFKFFSSWLVVLVNIIPLLCTMLRHLTFIEVFLLTTVIIVASFIILYEDVSVVREIRKAEELLYGDPMNRLRLVITLGLLAIIEAILILVLQVLKHFNILP